jgi:hypothetical protein
MIRHLIRIAAITIVAVACMFYPFLPGRYDRLAVTLSLMAQLLGLAGLLLVPIGATWLIYELVRLRARGPGQREFDAPSDKGMYFAMVALAASFVVAVVAALGAATQTGLSLGAFVLILWAYMAGRWMRRLWRSPSGTIRGFNYTPLYLILVPSILSIVRLAFLERAVEFSRNRAIAGSAEFINAIEAYHDRHGRYPLSLASSLSDYDPPVIGVERYHYEPSGRAYNVFFEQLTFPIGMREYVMYNPLDEHSLMVHDQDLLEATQAQIDAERNYHVSHHAHNVRSPAPPHWKFFWFD